MCRPYPLHTIFPSYQPRPRRAAPPANHSPDEHPENRPALPLSPADPAFSWHLDALLDRLNRTTASAWDLKTLAEHIADAEQMPEQAKTLHTILDRIQRFTQEPAGKTGRKTSAGSIPTMLRLHRFLAPLLSTPSSPLLLDDILTIHPWRITHS
jgi:hypothetical protein